MEIGVNNIIHPTAIVHDSVKMGNNNYVGPYAIIDENVVLGSNNVIGPHCIIGDLGESINFFNEPKKGVIIGDNNRFTKQVTIDSGTVNPTIIKNDNLWLKNAHAGHDTIAHDGVQVRCNAIIGGHVELMAGAKIFLGAIVHPRLVIPAKCVIGMGSIVVKKTELIENGVYVGSPARFLRFNNPV
jgi:UDP-N-acetylglucosamine acyltransferase